MPRTVRRRRRGNEAPVGKESWAILGPGGLLKEALPGESMAIALGQSLAQREDVAVPLTVQLRSLFGPAQDVAYIERDEHGTILTRTA